MRSGTRTCLHVRMGVSVRSVQRMDLQRLTKKGQPMGADLSAPAAEKVQSHWAFHPAGAVPAAILASKRRTDLPQPQRVAENPSQPNCQSGSKPQCDPNPLRRGNVRSLIEAE